MMTPSQLIEDFTKGRKYGSLEFEFRAGELTFVRRKETLIPATYEKNSTVVPKDKYGTHDRDANQSY